MDGRTGAEVSGKRRSSLLGAALWCFTEVGYEPTTVTEIRRCAAASTGTLYHYFPDGKAQLAAALHVEGLAGYQARSIAALEAAGGARAGIVGQVRYHLEWIADNPRLARFLFADRPREVQDKLLPGLRRLNQEYFGRIGAWWRRYAELGELQDVPLRLAVALWIGPAHHFGRQLATAQPPRRARTAEADLLCERAWLAVAADPGRTGPVAAAVRAGER